MEDQNKSPGALIQPDLLGNNESNSSENVIRFQSGDDDNLRAQQSVLSNSDNDENDQALFDLKDDEEFDNEQYNQIESIPESQNQITQSNGLSEFFDALENWLIESSKITQKNPTIYKDHRKTQAIIRDQVKKYQYVDSFKIDLQLKTLVPIVKLIEDSSTLNPGFAILIIKLIETIFSAKNVKDFEFTFKIVFAKKLIQLNELEEASFIVEEIESLEDQTNKIEAKLVLLSCCDIDDIIQSAFYSLEEYYTSFSQKYELYMLTCTAFRRAGKPESVRVLLNELIDIFEDQNQEKTIIIKLFSQNIAQLFSLLLYADLLTPNNYENKSLKNLVKLRDYAIESLSSCISAQQLGYRGFAILLQQLLFYEDIAKEAANTFMLDQLEILKNQPILPVPELPDPSKLPPFDPVIFQPFTTSYLEALQISYKQDLKQNIQANNYSISEIFQVLEIAKLKGDFELIVENTLAFFKKTNSIFGFEDLRNSFKNTNLDNHMDFTKILLDFETKSEEMFEQTKNEDFTKFNMISVYLQLSFSLSTSLLYLRQYNEALKQSEIIKMIIIVEEGNLSYNLLPILRLLKELQSILSLKSKATITQRSIDKIYERISII